MRRILDAAHEAGISAVIASDVAVMLYCRQIGQEVHLSTQLNISNAEALRFYAQFADVVVLARELNMEQVAEIHDSIERDGICGPSGKPVRIEMFCHGALCMAISGKCYLSQSNWGRSANRGECMQLCRRRYTVQDVETGTELDIENRYIMSPKDLKTIRFIDQMVDAGVRVFKIEGRARGPEYVDTVVRCYREAIDTLTDPELGRKAFLSRLDEWDERLARVFNRGFWDGYYLGKTIAEWNDCHGSKATERKVYCGCTVRYYSKLQVAEFKIEACELNVGDEILVTGPTTGALRATVSEIRYDLEPVDTARQGQRISIPVPAKVRPKDKLFVIKKIADNTSA
jgi:putative protease